MVIKGIASVILYLAFAAALIVGPLGPTSFVAGDRGGMGSVHQALGASDHDCCDPGPVSPDRTCASACTQAPCGTTALPIPAGWPANADCLAVRWHTVTALWAGITPDPAIPPPRV